ncbi:hypothetical protein B0I35DRAFT_434405 [Stachybotrys elegans]|uniref:Uncharacterized protein n=1 Tax=Stachybotrys elegans TaxID=80388 RepID=A0A8K0WRW6_9HYPO|nr:hypothetical protein B0I35DRAFT_434405 [Stachybotrys elegans]
MSDRPNLSLPARAPSMIRYHDQPMELHPVALYTLVELSDAELGDLQRECESACVDLGHEPGNCVRPAPQSRFVGEPLRAVFDYHLDLGTQNTYDPRYFVVAVGKDWRTEGVVLVTLDDDDLDCVVDQYRTKAADAGLSVVNLQIGNSSWSEEKDGYGLDPNDDSGSGDGDDDNDDDDDDDNDDEGPPAPTKNVPLGYYIPIYSHSGLDEDEVVARLTPGYKTMSPENIACTVQAQLTPRSSNSDTATTQDLVQQANTLHPRRCAKNKFLHKAHILVVDNPDPTDRGMVMVQLPPWDTTASKADLQRIGEELASRSPPYIRIPYAAHEGLQRRFLLICNGDTEWPSEEIRKQPAFIVFLYNTQGKGLTFGMNLIDPEAGRRMPGEERVVYAPRLIKNPGHGLERIEWSYDEAVRRFPWFCREQRFVEGLDRRFFMCVDSEDAAQTGILLVKRDWDGNLWGRTRDEVLNLPVDGVRSVRVPIREAWSLLERGRVGETDGMSEELKDFFS